ncbi:Velvet factor [Penicillium cataractarum]|uniref:Developmental and secondary metabolism regulator veA n=1 Tax=Penicillium cataractarum TaxID=2100454 RepID=A0A9W9RRI5_9EURO|nr:Velvet factor [Penicillium cataractarum]KAJ5364952.1 Velvet factor [Penicillium cataractarum]
MTEIRNQDDINTILNIAARSHITPTHIETQTPSVDHSRWQELTYNLSVIQQPERTRACGASANSAADRRPVDPPPVVELRISESDPAYEAQKTDVTTPHLPWAGSGTTVVSRLKGVPVARVAYLDRPSQAGYFIFPDLSVHHESRYRLSFYIYELIKNVMDADQDSNPALPNQVSGSNAAKPSSPLTYLYFRLEVKSIPFIVYGTHNFLRLATGTSLRCIIAERGYRVRIRRNVRMSGGVTMAKKNMNIMKGVRRYTHRLIGIQYQIVTFRQLNFLDRTTTGSAMDFASRLPRSIASVFESLPDK